MNGWLPVCPCAMLDGARPDGTSTLQRFAIESVLPGGKVNSGGLGRQLKSEAKFSPNCRLKEVGYASTRSSC
jgi:hypothetical protein